MFDRFRWLVPDAGFEWLKIDGEWMLTPIGGMLQQPCHFTVPMEKFPALFRDFAKLPPDRAKLRDFANKHGRLGIGNKKGKEVIVEAESLKDWCNHISQLNRAVLIFDMAQNQPDKLAELFDCDGEGLRFTRGLWKKIKANDPTKTVDDLITPALSMVQHWTNQILKEHTSALLLMNENPAPQSVFVVPKNLLGVLWLQFANGIAGHKSYRTCEYCGHCFEVSKEPGGATRRKRFCSDSCRQRVHRQRREQAASTTPQKSTPKKKGKVS